MTSRSRSLSLCSREGKAPLREEGQENVRSSVGCSSVGGSRTIKLPASTPEAGAASDDCPGTGDQVSSDRRSPADPEEEGRLAAAAPPADDGPDDAGPRVMSVSASHPPLGQTVSVSPALSSC